MFFTQNPIGSSATEDLQDNAISFDYAMNSPAALWQDRFGKQHKTVQQALKDVGFKPAGFDFVSGGTLGIGDRDKCVFYPTDGYWYSWNGKLPYPIPANSSPTPGGKKGWGVVARDDRVIAREALRRSYAEAGLNLVPGSFEQSGIVTNAYDVLLYEANGKAYSRTDGLPETVNPGSTPDGGWSDRSEDISKSVSNRPVTWLGFAGGADPTGATSSTSAFQESINQIGVINVPPGIYWIDASLSISDNLIVRGAGRGLTIIKYTGSSVNPLFKATLVYSSPSAVYLKDLTLKAGIPNCGAAVSVSTDAAAQTASRVVVGDLDKIVINNVAAYGDSSGNYWNCGIETIDCGGLNIDGFVLNNKTTAAQTDATVAGVRLKTTDPKVSVIRAISARNFYILRAHYGIETRPISNLAGGITSYYLSDFEIVGVKNGIKATNWCAAWRVTGHIDSTEQCLDFRGAAITNARFSACDFRKGNNGGLGYVAGPMVTLDYGEQLTFTGSTFSGINLSLADPSNVAFSFTNEYNGSYTFLATIDGNTFTKFHNVLGQTKSSSNIVVGPNSYNQIADAITFDSNLDTSFTLTSPVGSISQVVSLPIGDSAFTVNIPPNRFKSAPNFADARPVNNPTQTMRVVYDYAGSTSSSLLFRVYGVTAALSYRFGITVS